MGVLLAFVPPAPMHAGPPLLAGDLAVLQHAIKAPDGQTIAKGVTAYSSEDATRIAGLQSDQVEQELGYRGRPALVHRNDLVLEN